MLSNPQFYLARPPIGGTGCLKRKHGVLTTPATTITASATPARGGGAGMGTPRPLWGGAVECAVPPNWNDVSDVRPVPGKGDVPAVLVPYL